MLFLIPVCGTALTVSYSSPKPQHFVSRFSCSPSPIPIIPMRENGLAIKEWRVASYCPLSQSLITPAYLCPPSILAGGSRSELFLPRNRGESRGSEG